MNFIDYTSSNETKYNITDYQTNSLNSKYKYKVKNKLNMKNKLSASLDMKLKLTKLEKNK